MTVNVQALAIKSEVKVAMSGPHQCSVDAEMKVKL